MAVYSLWNRVRLAWNQSNPKPIHFGITYLNGTPVDSKAAYIKITAGGKGFYRVDDIYKQIQTSQTPNLKSSLEQIPKLTPRKLGIVFSSEWCLSAFTSTALFFRIRKRLRI
ncbi:Hypothetical_protein [Hexamita inflata]|uniref:Hypothetical_protein n=1 Tax=Hexamita inflata TaxID=28002 RepID=A0AA86TY60_9EUKA|nr:Hypothetical protein HINF_LOCUS19112 [Hexamita inflata]